MRPVKLLLIFLFLAYCGAIFSKPARATWTIDASFPNFTCGQGISSGNSMNCSSGAMHCAAVGTLIVIEVNYYQSSGAQTATASDANAYVWTTRKDSATAANNYRSYIFDTVSTGSSCDTFTITISGTVTFGIMRVTQATSSLGSAHFDSTATPDTFSTNSNPQVGPSLTTTANGDLIIATAACAAGSNGWGAGSGYTQIDASGANAWYAEYKIAGAAGTYNATFSNSTTCNFGVSTGSLLTVAYKEISTSAAFRNHSSLISFHPRIRKIPFDDRRHKPRISKT